MIGAEAVETTRPGDGDAEVPFDEGDGACAAAAPFCKGCCEAEGAETAASISWAEAEPRPPAEAAAAARRRPAVASLPRPLRPRRGGGARKVIFFSSIFSLCSICLIRSGKRAQEEEEKGGNGPALRERGERAGKKGWVRLGGWGFFFSLFASNELSKGSKRKRCMPDGCAPPIEETPRMRPLAISVFLARNACPLPLKASRAHFLSLVVRKSKRRGHGGGESLRRCLQTRERKKGAEANRRRKKASERKRQRERKSCFFLPSRAASSRTRPSYRQSNHPGRKPRVS